MKKCLICLLVTMLLLLPGLSLAQEQHAYQLTMGWEADADGLAELLTAWDKLDQATVPTLAQGLQELLNSICVTAGFQDDAGWLSCSYSGEDVFSLSLHAASQATHFLFSLLPGYVMTEPFDQQDASAVEAYAQFFSEADWPSLGKALQDEADAWLDSLTIRRETGSFIGDAYEGGAVRDTILLDDRDLSLLLEGWALCLEQSLPTEVISLREMITDLREINHGAALSNRFFYILHQVMGNGGSLVGYSLVVLEGEAQVATLSLGLGDPARLVLGLGYGGHNQYLEMTAKPMPTDEGQLYDIHMALYTDKARVGYQAAKAAENSLRLSADGQARLLAKDASYAWSLDLAIQDRTGTPIALRQTMEGSLSLTEPAFEHTTRLLLEETAAPILTETVHLVPSQPISFNLDGLTAITFDSLEDEEQSAMIDEIINDAAIDTALKLFKLLPPQLLTFLY